MLNAMDEVTDQGYAASNQVGQAEAYKLRLRVPYVLRIPAQLTARIKCQIPRC